jgi:hypothetical protein
LRVFSSRAEIVTSWRECTWWGGTSVTHQSIKNMTHSQVPDLKISIIWSWKEISTMRMEGNWIN